MDDSFAMDECQGLDNVADVVLDGGDFQKLLRINFVKYVVALEHLHGDVDVIILGVVEQLVHSCNIGVVKLAHDFKLLLELGAVFNGFALNGLDDAFFLSIYVSSLAYFSIGGCIRRLLLIKVLLNRYLVLILAITALDALTGEVACFLLAVPQPIIWELIRIRNKYDSNVINVYLLLITALSPTESITLSSLSAYYY